MLLSRQSRVGSEVVRRDGMNATELGLRGVLLIQHPVYNDHRGCFYEAFNDQRWAELLGQDARPFVQDNISVSRAGVFRGMHLQRAPHAQSKLVRVLSGCIIDFVLDVDPDSPQYGRCIGVPLDAHSGQCLYIPAGYAHGFLSLEDDTVLGYKVDEGYHPESEETYHYRTIWDVLGTYTDETALIVSEKDDKGIGLERE